MSRAALRWAVLVLVLALLLLVAGSAAMASPTQPSQAGSEQRIWPDETIYFLMIDRFYNGDSSNDGDANPHDPRTWHGGDIQGVIDRLDYINSLGFSAIWITPHLRNSGRDYHGYGAVDFFDTDPHFGTNETMRELVEQAHARGMKVIFDIVVNHTGPANPLVKERPDWFNPYLKISNWNDPHQVQNGWIFDLPDFDQSNPEVREYILSYSRFWIEQTGVDGFRLDTVKHVPREFFAWFSDELQKIKPGFWLLGEVWTSATWQLEVYQESGVTALLDFPVSEAARRTFGRDEAMSRLAGIIDNVGRLPDPWQMGAFLDNHDMPRFVSFAHKDDPLGRLKLGLIFLFTQRSIPILYYGTEIAMPGGDDPYNRVMYPWGEVDGSDIMDLVKQLNRIRRENPALRRGTLTSLLSDQWRYAYLRTAGSDRVVVVLNNHATDSFGAELDLSREEIAEGEVLRDALTGQTVTVTGGKIRPQVGPRAGAIYVLGSTPGPPVGQGYLLGSILLLAALVLLSWRMRRR